MSETKVVAYDAYEGSRSAIGLRVAPIDVGFDLRSTRHAVEVPAETTIASYAEADGRYVVTGTAAEIVGVLRRAGYDARLVQA